MELEKLYNEHTRRLLRKKSSSLRLSQTLKRMYLINDKKSKAVEFGVRMIYSADKYSSQLPEAQLFLEFLHPQAKYRLLWYLLLRLIYKINLRVGFLDHLKGNTPFDSFPVSFLKAKKLVQIACQKDPVLYKNLIVHLESQFESENLIEYYTFLTECSKKGFDSPDFNALEELVKVHLGKRKIFRKNRFEEAKQKNDNPFDKTPNEDLIETQKLNANAREEDFKSTQKLNRRDTSRSAKRSSSRPKSQSRSMSRSRSRSRVGSRVSFEPGETRKSAKRRFSPKPEKEVFEEQRPEEKPKKSILKIKPRKPLIRQVENILEERISGKEKEIIHHIEEEIRLKSEKVLNKFISRFSVGQNEIELYGHNLGYTVISKAQLAMAFVITRENNKFFTLMRQTLRDPFGSEQGNLKEHWDSLYRNYESLLEEPESEMLVKELVVQLFKFPTFKNEIVFLLKYFFKVRAND